MMNYLAIPQSSYASAAAAAAQSNASAHNDGSQFTMLLPQQMQAHLQQLQQQQHRPNEDLQYDVSNRSTSPTNMGSAASSATFPMKLHAMMTDSELLRFEDIVCWMGDRAFKVIDARRFAIEIMPKYFNQTKYKSFQRQLNIYNFQKVQYGPLKGGYTHPHFVKGRPDLCEHIKRDSIHGLVSGTAISSSSPSAAVPSSVAAPDEHKRVIPYDQRPEHGGGSGSTISGSIASAGQPMEVFQWDVDAEGAFGGDDSNGNSSERSTFDEIFESTVDEIAAFATNNMSSTPPSGEPADVPLPFDPTPLPLRVAPTNATGNNNKNKPASAMGHVEKRGSVASMGTNASVLDNDDIAFFKTLFQPGNVSQEKEILDAFLLENNKSNQIPQHHHQQQRAMLAPYQQQQQPLQHQPSSMMMMGNAMVSAAPVPPPAAALQQQQQRPPVMPYSLAPAAQEQPQQVVQAAAAGAAAAAVSEFNFPRKLFRLLHDCDTNPEYHSICSWLSDGKQFKIHDKKRFVEVILPNYFDQTQYASFRRQLNMYSFVRQSMSTYANPYFMRGRRELLDHVVRKNGSSGGGKKD